MTPLPFWYVATDGDWPEDFDHENGMYHCECLSCGKTFTGYKRRLTCKVCHNPNPLTIDELEELYILYEATYVD